MNASLSTADFSILSGISSECQTVGPNCLQWLSAEDTHHADKVIDHVLYIRSKKVFFSFFTDVTPFLDHLQGAGSLEEKDKALNEIVEVFLDSKYGE